MIDPRPVDEDVIAAAWDITNGPKFTMVPALVFLSGVNDGTIRITNIPMVPNIYDGIYVQKGSPLNGVYVIVTRPLPF